MQKKKTAAATYEQEQAVLWAIARGNWTLDAVAKHTNMTVEQVKTVLNQLNAESMKKHGKPFITFTEAVQ